MSNRDYFKRMRLIDIFGFADQGKLTYRPRYTLTLKSYNNNDTIIRIPATTAANSISKYSWYVDSFTSALENQNLIASKNFLCKNSSKNCRNQYYGPKFFELGEDLKKYTILSC